MAQQWPTLTAAHERFLQRRNDTLYITENHTPPPSPELLHDLRELIDRFASFGLTRDSTGVSEPMMDEDVGGQASTSVAVVMTTTRKIVQLVCRYETQQNDELVEEHFKLRFHKPTELTVPHTHHGLVAHALGAFLPHCTQLNTLYVHTCDHARLRQTIHQLPSLRLTVIRNDCSNGFWNTASLALLAQLRREDQVSRGKNGYNAVVVAHTNSSAAFSAPEWALATYLFMRHEVHPGERQHNNGEPAAGSRHILHDFADGAAQDAHDAAVAVVLCMTATTPPLVQPGIGDPHFAFTQLPTVQRRIEFSSISPRNIFLTAGGRNAFTPYIRQFKSCPPALIHVADYRENERQGPPHILFGRAAFSYVGGAYNVEHDLLLLRYRALVNDVRLHIHEMRPRVETDIYREIRVLDELIARKLRPYLPAVLPRVHVESKYGGLPASRALLAGCAVENLILDFHNDNEEDGIDHDNPTYGREDEVVTDANVDRPATAWRNSPSNLTDLCALISDMRRIDQLTLALRSRYEDPESLHISSNQMKCILNTVFLAPCGVTRLAIQNVPGRVADACLLHLLQRTDGCMIMDLALEVRTRPANDDAVAADEHINDILLQNVLAGRAGVVCRQLLSLTITPLPTRGGTHVCMDYLPALLDACTSLQHLSVDLRHFRQSARQRVQDAILRMADRLTSFQFQADADDMANQSSFTAAILERATNAVFMKINVGVMFSGINRVADALVDCMSRPLAEQINVTCIHHDPFSNASLRRLYFAAHEPGGNNVGICLRANFAKVALDLAQPMFRLDEGVTVIERQRNREGGADDDVRYYRAPSDNSMFVEASIEQVFQRLSMHSEVEAKAEDAKRVEADALAAQAQDTGRAWFSSEEVLLRQHMLRRDHVGQAGARRAAQARRMAGAYYIREITSAAPVTETPEEDDYDVAYPRRPVVITTTPVRWSSSNGRVGARISYVGDRAPVYTADDDDVVNSEPRGDIVVMTRQQQDAVQAQMRIDQLHRTLWLFDISEEISLYPDTTVGLQNFAPEVQMAASRVAYQANLSSVTGTPGCAAFGRFFDESGFVLQGFPTPGNRPQDAHAAIRVARYFQDMVPGPRTHISRANHRIPAMEYQLDNYGVVFGNENVACPTLPARYNINPAAFDVPTLGPVLRAELAAGGTANAIIHRVFDQLARASERFPSDHYFANTERTKPAQAAMSQSRADRSVTASTTTATHNPHRRRPRAAAAADSDDGSDSTSSTDSEMDE